MTQFTSGFEPTDLAQPGMPGPMGGYTTTDAGYSAYSTGADAEPNYHSNPFTAMASQEAIPPGGVAYQQPPY